MGINLLICVFLFAFVSGSSLASIINGNTCKGKPNDVIFLVDASRSIWRPHFEAQLRFVVDVIKKFNVGRGGNDTRIAVATYAQRIWPQFNLRDFYRIEQLEPSVMSIHHMGGHKTNTAIALNYVTTRMLKPIFGARRNSSKVIVLLTDGQSQDNGMSIKVARKAKEKGIVIIALAVGRRLILKTLDQIVSRPIKDHLFLREDFLSLDGISDDLARRICNASVPETTIPALTSTAAPLRIIPKPKLPQYETSGNRIVIGSTGDGGNDVVVGTSVEGTGDITLSGGTEFGNSGGSAISSPGGSYGHGSAEDIGQRGSGSHKIGSESQRGVDPHGTDAQVTGNGVSDQSTRTATSSKVGRHGHTPDDQTNRQRNQDHQGTNDQTSLGGPGSQESHDRERTSDQTTGRGSDSQGSRGRQDTIDRTTGRVVTLPTGGSQGPVRDRIISSTDQGQDEGGSNGGHTNGDSGRDNGIRRTGDGGRERAPPIVEFPLETPPGSQSNPKEQDPVGGRDLEISIPGGSRSSTGSSQGSPDVNSVAAGDIDPSLIVSNCGGKPADIYFVLDTSNSIWPEDFKSQLGFVSDLISIFDISEDKTRIGVVTFSDIVNPVISIDSKQEKEDILERVANITFLTGRTDTGGALKFVRERGFSPDVARREVAHIMLVFTDGLSKNPTFTAQEAALARKAGIYLFAIGIGESVEREELQDIASDPDDDFLFHVSDFGALNTIKNILAIKTCAIQADDSMVYIQGCSINKPTDLMFVYDSSQLGTRKTKLITEFVDGVTHALYTNSRYLRAGRLTENCLDSADVRLTSDQRSLSYERVKFPEFRKLISKLATSGFKTWNGGRHNSKKIAVLFLDDDISNLREAAEEIKRLRDADTFVITIGDVDPIMAGRFSTTVSDDYIVHIPSYKYLSTARSTVVHKLCNILTTE